MKNNRRVVENRQKQILGLVREKGEVRADELSSALGVSVMTIRRDLGLLESQKLLRRTHGGAVSFERVHTARRFGEEVQVCRCRCDAGIACRCRCDRMICWAVHKKSPAPAVRQICRGNRPLP